MVGAVVVTHGKLAEALVEAAEAITGKMDKVRTVTVASADSTDGIRGVVSAAVKEADSGKGVVVFTDMFGGTPTNIALSLMNAGKVEVITGVNLPMIIKFVGHRSDKPLHELAAMLREYGQKSIVLAGEMLKDRS
ncbi:PTS system, mannose-specific IIA component [uncultured bacterium]|nr:PTS system, mannose-specific IIA component [uncultured bacterium]